MERYNRSREKRDIPTTGKLDLRPLRPSVNGTPPDMSSQLPPIDVKLQKGKVRTALEGGSVVFSPNDPVPEKRRRAYFGLNRS